MPEAAKAHTKAGAKAFAVYFWSVADYATRNNDSQPVRALVRTDCAGCTAAEKFIDETKSRGGSAGGVRNRLAKISVSRREYNGAPLYDVQFELTNDPETITYPDGSRKQFPTGTTPAHLLLEPVAGGWLVATLESL